MFQPRRWNKCLSTGCYFAVQIFSAHLRVNKLRSYTATIYIKRILSGLQSQTLRLLEFHDATNEVSLCFEKAVSNT